MLNEWVFNDISMTCESFLALSWNDLIFINVDYLIFILIYRIVYHRFYEDSAELHVLKVEPLSRLKELARVSYFCFISMYGLSKDHEFVSKALKKLCDLALIDLNILISMLMYVSS